MVGPLLFAIFIINLDKNVVRLLNWQLTEVECLYSEEGHQTIQIDNQMMQIDLLETWAEKRQLEFNPVKRELCTLGGQM